MSLPSGGCAVRSKSPARKSSLAFTSHARASATRSGSSGMEEFALARDGRGQRSLQMHAAVEALPRPYEHVRRSTGAPQYLIGEGGWFDAQVGHRRAQRGASRNRCRAWPRLVPSSQTGRCALGDMPLAVAGRFLLIPDPLPVCPLPLPALSSHGCSFFYHTAVAVAKLSHPPAASRNGLALSDHPRSDALALLEASFISAGKIVALDAALCRSLLRQAATDGIVGGRVYDAVIARCATKGNAAALLTFKAPHGPQPAPPLAPRQTPQQQSGASLGNLLRDLGQPHDDMNR